LLELDQAPSLRQQVQQRPGLGGELAEPALAVPQEEFPQLPALAFAQAALPAVLLALAIEPHQGGIHLHRCAAATDASILAGGGAGVKGAYSTLY
jgi:hypothetical protein